MSSSDIALSVRGLCKDYIITHEEKHTTLGEKVTARLKNPLHRPRKETFRALQDVSFDVKKGEVVGIIGRNGAGKSTLLKVLSRITEPTAGEVELYGRVGSLLEVGTGFHPELTGRENIFLNGAILGMKRPEIRKHFDEIVAFAEIEEFLDTPVKRYSSGMYVRLAFAVAAHLNPEILIVDEVLSVGDAEFQKKCLGKMQDVSKGEGRTVLFVSHNITAIRSLCTKAIFLKQGELLMDASVQSVVDQYMRPAHHNTEAIQVFSQPIKVSLWMTKSALLLDGRPTTTVPMGSKFTIEVAFRANPATRNPKLGFVVIGSDGSKICCANNRYQGSQGSEEQISDGIFRCELGSMPLMPGSYTMALYLGHIGADTHVIDDAIRFEVTENDLWGQGKLPPSSSASMWWPADFRLSSSISDA